MLRYIPHSSSSFFSHDMTINIIYTMLYLSSLVLNINLFRLFITTWQLYATHFFSTFLLFQKNVEKKRIFRTKSPLRYSFAF